MGGSQFMNNVELKALEKSLKKKFADKECMTLNELKLVMQLIELKRFENKMVEETIELLRGTGYAKGIQN